MTEHAVQVERDRGLCLHLVDDRLRGQRHDIAVHILSGNEMRGHFPQHVEIALELLRVFVILDGTHKHLPCELQRIAV